MKSKHNSYSAPFLGTEVTVHLDRPMGSRHPKYGFLYPVNYGFIPNTKAPDGEEIDAYVLGVSEPLNEFTGTCLAIIKREDDDDDKLVVVPKDVFLTKEEIRTLTEFQEQFFKSTIVSRDQATATEYKNSLLVDLYDIINPYAADTKFYVELIESLNAKSVLDIGCGTGILAAELIEKDISVIGIDPSKQMLDIAKARVPDGKGTWIQGTAKDIPQVSIDIAVMTGHVAQVFLDEAEWVETLFSVYNALKTGGYLVFESRNLNFRPWESWNKEKSFHSIEDQKHGKVEIWHELKEVADTLISFDTHYKVLSSGDTVVSQNKLIFRSKQQIEESLEGTGFEIEYIYGDWNKNPIGEESKELIFIAKKRLR